VDKRRINYVRTSSNAIQFINNFLNSDNTNKYCRSGWHRQNFVSTQIVSKIFESEKTVKNIDNFPSKTLVLHFANMLSKLSDY